METEPRSVSLRAHGVNAPVGSCSKYKTTERRISIWVTNNDTQTLGKKKETHYDGKFLNVSFLMVDKSIKIK